MIIFLKNIKSSGSVINVARSIGEVDIGEVLRKFLRKPRWEDEDLDIFIWRAGLRAGLEP